MHLNYKMQPYFSKNLIDSSAIFIYEKLVYKTNEGSNVPRSLWNIQYSETSHSEHP